MALRLFSIALLLACSSLGIAQVYSEQKTQHRFAQTYTGINTQIIPSSGSLVFHGQEQAFPMQVVPRFTLGGMHFWGKLDFNMNIPLTSFGSNELAQDGEVQFSTGADLSARYYPWQLLDGKLRPFLGVSYNTMSLVLESPLHGLRGEGIIAMSALAGFSLSHKGWRLNAEWMFLPNNERDFYSTTSDKHQYELPNHYLAIGLVRHFDFTLSNEKPKQSGETKALESKILSKGKHKLNSLSLGIAANGAYFLQSPTFANELQSLPKHKGSINMEYSLGYLLHRQKLHFGLTYRNYSSNSVSYNLEHIVRRQALSLEGFKFVWDYHGFLPFVGLSFSAERWAAGLFIDDVQQGETKRTQLFSPGIIFGWDILPSPLETWVLRTNLRYYPYQKINDIAGQSTRVDQFEFNFIQLVVYPNRLWEVHQAKK